MECVHEAGDQILAQLLKSELDAHGIECLVEGEHLAPLLGGAIPASGNPFRVCVVHDEDIGRARVLVRDWLARREARLAGPSWRCQGCGEENEPQFEVCWSCSAPGPDA